MSHREYLTRLAWLEEQWNIPSLTHHYLMQVAQEVRRGWIKKPSTVKSEHFRLKFTSVTKESKSKSSETYRNRIIKSAKAAWLGTVKTIGNVPIIFKTKKRSEIVDSSTENTDGE
jgi:hypothetical protein